MKTSLSTSDLGSYVSNQLNTFFPDGQIVRLSDFRSSLDLALDRVHHSFKHSSIRWYFDGEQALFSHLFSDQYASFLWFLSNTLWQAGAPAFLLDKLFCLNKALHAFECMYNTHLPSIFFLSHTVGTVLGKATYSDFLVVSQGCTVGTHRGKYPVLGRGVALASNASVIGDCQVGDLSSIGSSTTVFQRAIPNSTALYRNEFGQLMQKKSLEPYAQKFFNCEISER
jgi:serine O-acetyltransferase